MAAEQVLGQRVEISQAALHDALDPEAAVSARARPGGAAPEAVECDDRRMRADFDRSRRVDQPASPSASNGRRVAVANGRGAVAGFGRFEPRFGIGRADTVLHSNRSTVVMPTDALQKDWFMV